MDEELSAQQRAEKKRQEKRKNAPTFTTVRFTGSEKEAIGKKAFVNAVLEKYGGTREAALLAAFEALENNLK